MPFPDSLTLARLVFVALLIASTAQAQVPREEDDEKDKPWQEVQLELPAPPQVENLLPFYVGPNATQSFAIDAASVSVGADGVVRYTLVATSDSGARNVSYEGIRCQSYERKLYAFGRLDGQWSRARRDRWERVYGNALNRQHAALIQDYFCQATMVAGQAKEIVARIRDKKPLSDAR